MDRYGDTTTIPYPEDVPVLDVETAGRLAFHLGRSASYAAARRGDLPTLRVGRRVVVPTAQLRRLLGLAESAPE